MSSPAAPPVSPSRSFRTFGGHPLHTDGELLALGFAADGTLCSVEEPGLLRRWDLRTQRQLDWHPLEGPATLWAFGGGDLVAAGSHELVVWDAATGLRQAEWAQPSWVDAVAFTADGQLLAAGGDDATVRLWGRSGQGPLRALLGHERAVSALAFSADGTRLASAGEEKVIRIWDVRTGALLAALAGHTDRIPALAWHPDGKRLFSAGWDTTVRVWDVAKGEPIILLNSHAGQVHALAVSPDGRRAASADSDNVVHVWDVARYRPEAVLREQAGEVHCLAFSPDSQVLASGGAERIIHLWDARRGPDQPDQVSPPLARTGLAVAPGGKLASLAAGTALRVWDLATGQPALDLEGAPVLRAFAASPDGRWFAASRAEGAGTPEWRGGPPIDRTTLGLWDARTGRRHAPLEGQAAPITALAFSADSTLLASGGFLSSDVWLWRVPAAEVALLIPSAVDGCSVEALAFQPEGRLLAVGGIDWLATGGSDGQVALWDAREGKLQGTLRGGALALAFHPGGHLLAVASLEDTVRVWDVAEGRLAHELLGHLEAVTCVAYSPDGRWLASGGDDRMVYLWDAATGLQAGAQELDTQVKALAFTPDGKQLATGNGNTSCYLLEVRRVLGAGG
jgi:WD40 repeat protein